MENKQDKFEKQIKRKYGEKKIIVRRKDVSDAWVCKYEW